MLRAIIWLVVLLSAVGTVYGQAATAPASQPAGVEDKSAEMQFKKFVIKDDPQFTGMQVTEGLIPADWTLTGGPVWNMLDARPMQMRVHIADAHDVSAFDVYPNHFFYWSRAAARQGVAANTRYMGAFVEPPPADQFLALAQVTIARDRPDLAQARVVEQEKLPDLAKAAFAALGQNPNYVKSAMAGRVTFEYDLKGQAMQEQFTLIFEQAVNQRLGFLDWQVVSVTSTRAPKGQLDKLAAIRAMVDRSCRPNLAFYTKVSNFVIDRQRLTIRQLNDQQQQRQTLQNARGQANDEEKKAFEQHMADLDKQEDAEADVQRQVSPWKTGGGETYKLPTEYGHAWSSADGRIIMNNDPRYNPNEDPSLTPTQWTQMEQAGN